jgi:hypothetical protein
MIKVTFLALVFFLVQFSAHAATPAEDAMYASQLLSQIDTSRLSPEDVQRLQTAQDKLVSYVIPKIKTDRFIEHFLSYPRAYNWQVVLDEAKKKCFDAGYSKCVEAAGSCNEDGCLVVVRGSNL